MEIIAEIAPRHAQDLELNVLRSPGAEEATRILCFRDRGYRNRMAKAPLATVVSIDTSRASLSADVRSRPPETAQVHVGKDEPLTLRVFIDRSVVEVFVNGQCLAVRVYPERKDSIGVSLRARGRDALLTSLDAWQMRDIYGFDRGTRRE
jgi:beta-fructofuranosidase